MTANGRVLFSGSECRPFLSVCRCSMGVVAKVLFVSMHLVFNEDILQVFKVSSFLSSYPQNIDVCNERNTVTKETVLLYLLKDLGNRFT